MSTPIDDVLTDLEAEYGRIDAILDGLSPQQWERPSAAPGWSVCDTLYHLAVTEEGVATVIAQGDGVWTTRDRPLDEVIEEGMADNTAPPAEVFGRWRSACRASLAALGSADPDVAVQWAAAPLKPRTLATTRLAEHWAHTLDIVEPLGLEYPDTDRLRHIAWLGHSTLPYAMRLAGLDPVPIRATLTAPSGSVFEYGPPEAASTVSGEMGAFCRVGARRLAAETSGLMLAGPDAMSALRVLRNYAA
jgi:uncharacterized protein (TIGR03084 family)